MIRLPNVMLLALLQHYIIFPPPTVSETDL